MAEYDGSRERMGHWMAGRLSRRAFIGRAAVIGASGSALATLLAACGASDAALKGTTAPATSAPATTNAPAATTASAASVATAAPSAVGTTAAGSPAGDASASTSGAACMVAPPDKAVTVSYLGNKFPIIEYYGEQLKSCENVKNVKVNLDWLPSNEKVQKATLILSGGDNSYDIIQATDGNIYEWADKNWILPLDDLVAKYKTQYNLADFADATLDRGRINGKQYGWPIDQNAQIFFYRKDIWDKYSLKPLITWDEAIEQFKMLQAKKETTYPYSATYAKGSDFAGEFARHLKAAGGQWFNGTAAAFNDAKGVAAAKKMKELFAYMAPDILTYTNDKVMIALLQGDAACASLYISRTAQMDDPTQSKVVGKIAYAPDPSYTPTGPVGTLLGGDDYAIPAKTKTDPDLIFRVILEVTKTASMKGGANLGWMTRTSVADDPEVVAKNRYLPAVQDAIKRGAGPGPKVPYYGLATAAVGSILPTAMTGGTSIEDALNQAAKEYETQAKEKGFIK